MGPVNSITVLIAALVAAAVLWAFWRARLPLWGYALTLIPAAMLGHALARIGPDKLAAKPQLYFMQSGGLALAIVLPAVWMIGLRDRSGGNALAQDSSALILAFLAMGAVFWLSG